MTVKSEMLARTHYFAGLSPSELEAVRKYVTLEKTCDKGEVILVEDGKCEYLYFVVSGVAKVYKRSPDGREQILNIATPGESVNDVATFDGGLNNANMLAMTPVHIYGVKKSDVEALFFKYPAVARNVARVLAERVRRDSALVEELSFDQVMNRLAKWLLRHVTEGAEALPRLTQQDLADMVGTSRVVVNRSLRTMEEKGAIRLERHRIVIADEEALKELISASYTMLSKRKKFGENT